MMTQWGLGQTEHDARTKRASRAMTLAKALGLALVLSLFVAGGIAKAARPLRVRHVAAARYTDRTSTHAARSRTKAASAHAHSVRASSASYKPAAGEHYRARSRAAKPRPARAVAPASAGRPATLHRVSARHRHGGRRGYRKQNDVVAQTLDDEPTRAASGAGSADKSTDAQAVAPTPSALADKPLTVDDFVRAASLTTSPASGIYASGVAQPDEDVSLTGPHASTPAATTPRLAARPAEMASVEASTAQREPAPRPRSAPSDLVGAPLAATQRGARAAVRDASPEDQATTQTHAELAEEVEQPVVLPGLYRYGRLVVPPPMRGTREILVHQNRVADEEGLTRIQDEADLRRMRTVRTLVDFPVSASLRVNPELAGDHRCARPWTVRFASDISRAYYARFHEPLQVNSAVRTVSYQLRLRRVNGNAAGTEGDVASPHLTGEALDFGKHGMSTAEIAWMRLYLRPLMQDGKLDVEEEFQQACFHISVYRAYAPGLSAPRRRSNARSEVAQLGEIEASSN